MSEQTQTPVARHFHPAVIYALVFFGGFANLATEMIGPRMFASIFGYTTVVWAILISVTLVGLSVGYAIGGRIEHERIGRVLPFILIVDALWLLAAGWLVWQVPADAAAQGVALDAALIGFVAFTAFFVPSALFGTVSPMAITLLSHEADQTQSNASPLVGNVYALGTVGSVAGALGAAFVLMPWVGLTLSLQIFAIILVAFAAYFWTLPNRPLLAVALVVCLLFPQPSYVWSADQDLTLLAQQEGYYQTIRVYSDEETFVQLHLGPTFQSKMDINTGEPLYNYANAMIDYVDLMPDVSGQRALVIGGAGHVLARSLETRGMIVTEVEIDPFVIALSTEHFGSIDGEIIQADGRAYIRTVSDSTYDLILVDAFDGAAAVPPQLATVEFFEEIERVLTPNGIMIYNFVGTPEGVRSRSFLAMGTTINAAFAYVGASDITGDITQNIIFTASPAPLPFDTFPSPIDGILLTDQRNPIDILTGEGRGSLYFRR